MIIKHSTFISKGPIQQSTYQHRTNLKQLCYLDPKLVKSPQFNLNIIYDTERHNMSIEETKAHFLEEYCSSEKHSRWKQ